MKNLFSKYFTEYDKLKENEKYCKLIEIKNEISLTLNPNGVIDNEILNSLEKLTNNKNSTLRKKLEIKIKVYLKCEWERIKFETKEGLKEYDFEYEFEKILLINHKIV